MLPALFLVIFYSPLSYHLYCYIIYYKDVIYRIDINSKRVGIFLKEILLIAALFLIGWCLEKLSFKYINYKRERLRDKLLKKNITYSQNAYDFGKQVLSELSDKTTVIQEGYENAYKHGENTIYLTEEKINSNDFSSILAVIHEIGHSVHMNTIKQKHSYSVYIGRLSTVMLVAFLVFIYIDLIIFGQVNKPFIMLYCFFLSAKSIKIMAYIHFELGANRFVNSYLKKSTLFSKEQKRYLHKFKYSSFSTYLVGLIFPVILHLSLLFVYYFRFI